MISRKQNGETIEDYSKRLSLWEKKQLIEYHINSYMFVIEWSNLVVWDELTRRYQISFEDIVKAIEASFTFTMTEGENVVFESKSNMCLQTKIGNHLLMETPNYILDFFRQGIPKRKQQKVEQLSYGIQSINVTK